MYFYFLSIEEVTSTIKTREMGISNMDGRRSQE